MRLADSNILLYIETLRRIPVQPVTEQVFRRATELSNRFGISYWDASILAAAGIIGCEAVYSEDMNDQQDYGGLRVINPFSSTALG